MSNGRSMRRKMSGKSGSSPGKSRRRQMKRQRAAWQMQAALAQMSTATEPLLETMRDAFGGKKENDEPTTEDGVGAEEEVKDGPDG